ncbi:unnamed protein product [Periconia digitata]|uniref:Uncharacterized protein n=1 Tax=Periconia digitata TaxID=1303443 RepID=A0A9W4UMH1_9PLEO|nr:unnamed protein product [Periconia digitata]
MEATNLAHMASPLFRLPRELRDEIYAYHVYEHDGYFHSFASGKLSCSDQRPIDLDLMFTCKAIAQEMRGVALLTNKVTFTTGRSEIQVDDSGDISLAGRFERLLTWIRAIKMQMLVHAHECVTPDILDQIQIRHPYVGALFADRFRAAISTTADDVMPIMVLVGSTRFLDDNQVPLPVQDALDTALTLASSDPRFKGKALQAFEEGQNFLMNMTLVPEAYDMILQYRPCRWQIPDPHELASFEALMRPSDPNFVLYDSMEYRKTRNFSVGVWYFSATAVAIQFLKRMSERGLRLRNIILDEDYKGVAHPAYHIAGLIPFCQRDPQLRINRRVGSIYLSDWDHIADHFKLPFRDDVILMLYQTFVSMVDWVCATGRLLDLGMPPQSCFTTFVVRSDSDLNSWSALKVAAFWQESMLKWFKRQGGKLPPLTYDRWGGPYALPIALPMDFSEIVHALLKGDLSVRCQLSNAAADNLPELSEGYRIRDILSPPQQNWDIKTWRKKWGDVQSVVIKLPEGGERTLTLPYVRHGYGPPSLRNFRIPQHRLLGLSEQTRINLEESIRRSAVDED